MATTKRMALVETTPPTSYPVTVDEAREHCRIGHTDDDPYISDLIGVAVEHAQTHMHRQIMPATWTLYLDNWPDVIELPRPPLASVTHLKYYDTGATLQTLTAVTDYVVDTYSTPGRITLAYTKSWPDLHTIENAIECKYIAGYATAALVPLRIKQAIKLMVRHWYAMREPVITGVTLAEVPMTIQALLAPYVVPIF